MDSRFIFSGLIGLFFSWLDLRRLLLSGTWLLHQAPWSHNLVRRTWQWNISTHTFMTTVGEGMALEEKQILEFATIHCRGNPVT
jgi:hypothetical protein